MIEAVVTKPEEAIAQSEAHINDFLFRGGVDTEAEDVEVGEKFGVGELIKAAWVNAKEIEDLLSRSPSLLLFCLEHNLQLLRSRSKLWRPSQAPIPILRKRSQSLLSRWLD
jgi:hypothetical protein